LQRVEAKRAEHKRAREVTRAKFEEQMRLLEAEHREEERAILSANAPGTGEAASAPTTPPGHADADADASQVPAGVVPEEPAPIGAGRENGAKSMPGSRRTSGYGTFGFEKLSLSVMEPGSGRKEWKEEDEVDAEGAQSELEVSAEAGESFRDLRSREANAWWQTRSSTSAWVTMTTAWAGRARWVHQMSVDIRYDVLIYREASFGCVGRA
jgi:hypothetical protein